VSGSGAFFDPYIDGLLFLSNSTSSTAIKVDASGSTFFGYSFAQRGRIALTGSSDKFYCGILADQIDIAAQDLRVTGSGCTRPTRTNAPPTLVPSVVVGVAVDKTDVLPANQLIHTATVTNTGATRRAGVIGVENLGTAGVTVSGHARSRIPAAGDGSWHPLPGDVTITVRRTPSAASPIRPARSGRRHDGPARVLASWLRGRGPPDGRAGRVPVDPAQVRATRSVSTFTMNPTTPVAACSIRGRLHRPAPEPRRQCD
jgi:hypothetical protein